MTVGETVGVVADVVAVALTAVAVSLALTAVPWIFLGDRVGITIGVGVDAPEADEDAGVPIKFKKNKSAASKMHR